MASNFIPRAHTRIPVMLIAELTQSGPPCWARVRDLSDGGMRLATRTRLKVGQIVEVRLATSGWISARVIWSTKQVAGLRFCKRIDASEQIRHALTHPAEVEAETAC